MRILALLAVLGMCGVGCSSTDDSASSGRDGDGPLNQRIAAAVRLLETSPCRDDVEDRAKCPWRKYPLEPGAGHMAKSSGEALLIIDEFHGGAPFYTFYRYANQLVGYYRVNGEGGLDERHESAEMPTVMGDVLTSFADSTFLPASRLSPVANALRGIARKVGIGTGSHGAVTFQSLAELVPEQPIVLVDIGYPYATDPLHAEFCVVFSNAEARQRLRTRMSHLRDSLRGVMARHNVRFVNASFGDNKNTILADVRRSCPGLEPSVEEVRQVLAQLQPEYEALFATDGVFATHASAEYLGPDDSPFDTPRADFPNRLRIGVGLSQDSGIDPQGRGDPATVARIEVFPKRTDSDVFINSGCDGVSCGHWPQRIVDSLGLEMMTFPLAQPSWIAPVALARFINLRYERHAGEPMSNSLIANMKEEMAPRLCGADEKQPCLVQDPIRHKQFEIHRLSYLP